MGEARRQVGRLVLQPERPADDLAPIPCMTPGVMSQFRMEPEMKVFFIQGALLYLMKLLADKKPGDLLVVFRVDGTPYD